MVLFKSAGLTCSRENQVPPFFGSLPAGESKKEKQAPLFVPSLPNLPVWDRYVPSQYLCTLETDCVHLALFLFVIFCRDRHSKQSICTIFRDRYIFFYILELCYQGPYCWSQNQVGGTDMTWHGIILVSKYVWYLRCFGWSSWNQWTIGLFQPEWLGVKEHEKGGKQWKWLEGGLFLIVIYGRLSKQLWHWCLLALVIHCTLLTLTVHSTFEIQPYV